MRNNTTLSQPAEAGNGIEDMRKLLGEYYDVEEIPVQKTQVRMEISELEKFCKRTSNLPIFRLKVEAQVVGAAVFPIETPYMKYFTIWNDMMFYATEPIEKKEPISMDGGQIHVV